MQDIGVVTKQGFKPIAYSGVLLLFALIFGKFVLSFLAIFLAVVFIYRNPERAVPTDDEYAVLSPIDGKVKSVEKILFLDKEFTAVTITNAIFNVGALRSPCDLKLLDFKQRHGLFLYPHMKISSILNERNLFICENKKGDQIGIRVIVGAFGRSLKLTKFDTIKAGRRFGFLLDGSVVLMLPTTTRISVAVGQKLKALEILGFLSYEGKNAK